MERKGGRGGRLTFTNVHGRRVRELLLVVGDAAVVVDALATRHRGAEGDAERLVGPQVQGIPGVRVGQVDLARRLLAGAVARQGGRHQQIVPHHVLRAGEAAVLAVAVSKCGKKRAMRWGKPHIISKQGTVQLVGDGLDEERSNQ